uniref:Uncharacterized protein n=1 Tax=Ciona savignyi TaxID=51511 RepID=H2Z7T5_CIOSA
MRQIKQINEDQRKKDKTALSVWRNETKRRQRLPRSKTADVTWKPPPLASNEQLVVHNEVREEKVETILPGEHKLRNRTNDEILQRMKQHSSQIHKQIQQQRSEAQTAPSRELQRQLLDRKMSKDDQLEYRFKAFTGDSVSGHSSSNKTTLS